MPTIAGINVTAEQMANAQTIADVGRSRGASDRDIAVAIATAMQESNLRNLKYGDRDSVGLFQQRTSQGWGTIAQIMDPRYSAGKFYDGLLKLPNRDRTPLTVLAQKVQRSAYPNAYAKWEALGVALAGGGSASGPPTDGGGYLPRPPLMASNGTIDVERAIAEYGFVAQMAADVPDLKRVLDQAIREKWEPNGSQFTAALQATAWYRNSTAGQRKVAMLKATQPGEYKAQRDAAIMNVWAMVTKLGAAGNDEMVGRLADQYLTQGWDDRQLQRYVAAEIHVDGRVTTGLTAATIAQLKDEASQYLVELPLPQLEKWTRDILSGDLPADAFRSFLMQQAKAQFPPLAGALDSGITVEQYLDPYKKLAAQTLEMAPEAVSFMDPQFRNPIMQQDAQGNRGIMGLSQYESYLKQLPQYRNTRQANQSAAGLTSALLEKFGKVAQ